MNHSDHQSLQRLIEQTALKFPQKIAVVSKEGSFSYEELNDRANSIAERLRRSGVGRNVLVGLHLDRSVTMVAAMLAIHKAGGAYLPLDPQFPRSRLNDIVRDADLGHLVYDGVLNIDVMPKDRIDLSAEMLPIPAAPCPHQGAESDYRDLAYVMYTSGSTGRPKGVKVHQGAVVNFLHSMQAEPGMGPDDILLAVTTPSFDISVLEIFLPLLVGGTIILASKDEVVDGRKLVRLIQKFDVSMMQATPATWRMLFMAGWSGSPRLKALCGGESLDNALAAKLVSSTKSTWNMYGPTETTVWSCCGRIADPLAPISVGRPIQNTTIRVLDESLKPLPDGEAGELYIGGLGVALGYMDDALTAARFIPDPTSGDPAVRIYKTGDRGSRLRDGTVRVDGRSDDQVKVKGNRIELNDVRAHVLDSTGIVDAAIVCKKDGFGENRLIAFVTMEPGAAVDRQALKEFLATRLPDYMIPSAFVALQSIPLTPNGKADRKALLELEVAESGTLEPGRLLYTSHKELLTHIVRALVSTADVGLDEDIFDLGIDSLQANYMAAVFGEHTGIHVSVAELFQHPTINSFITYLESARDIREAIKTINQRTSARERRRSLDHDTDGSVAIVGMAGRFPGANTLDRLWEIVAGGIDTVTRFPREQDDPLIEDEIANDPHYVRARGMIENPDLFDAAFFGIPPNDAAVMDPQQRVFLELAWEAFENAGYDSDRFDGLVGVYAGMGNNFYYFHNVSTRPQLIKMVGEVQVEIGREKDHIATLVSHKLNLTGPSLSLHTACSTGLVAIDAAYQSLLSRQCDMALAGAIELRTPQMSGQIHEPSGVFTSDGRCRPFSHNASGTMFSDGAGTIVLKRLHDAIADGDNIRAVIRGSAVNHDGFEKKSYLAPNVWAQTEVIATAQARARVRPDTITYMEAHGTATPVGDPIEFQALKNAFEFDNDRRNYCAIGSVKANLGHPTTAAGVVGVIKVCLALEHKKIPPLANFEKVNPNIDIEDSPFFITTRLIDWQSGDAPRRAGVSSFGFCGTNAHVVLEEAPERVDKCTEPSRPYHAFLLSAATETALQTLTDNLLDHLSGNPTASVADVAYTLAMGRKRLRYRRSLVCCADDTHNTLDLKKLASVARKCGGKNPPQIAFVFPGQGSQYIGMGRGLYESEPVFRETLDRCATLLALEIGEDIRNLMIAFDRDADDPERREKQLNNTYYTQPAIFCLEYSLARLWLSWGVMPQALIGHSIGEFVCGVLAGVFSLEDAIKLIATRGKLMASLPPGGMLSVRLPHDKLIDELGPQYSIASINSANLCVVSGRNEDIDTLAAKLADKGVRCQRLHTSHAFHSWMMDPVVEPFLQIVRSVKLDAPSIPIISTVTGQHMTAKEAQDPNYWAQHLRATVRFAQAVSRLWEQESCVLLEVGPRGTMSSLAMSSLKRPGQQVAIPSLGDSHEEGLEQRMIAQAIGQLWMHEVELDWAAYCAGRPGARVVLPTYPFERKRYWVTPAGRERRNADLDSRAEGNALGIDMFDSRQSQSPGTASSDPKDVLIEQLKAILRGVSGEELPDLPPTATFSQMGFDSLMLTPITFMIKETFGVPVSFRQLLNEITTLEMLAEYVGDNAPADAKISSSKQTVALEHDISAQFAPATLQQTEILRHAKSSDDIALTYLESVSIELIGALDIEALRRSIGFLVDRHAALRVSFTPDGQQMRTMPRDNLEPPIKFVEGRLQTRTEIERREMETVFDPTEQDMVRFTVAELSDTSHVVVITAHNAVCDGWSMDVLIEELARIYSAVVAGEPVSLAAAHQLQDYAKAAHELSNKADYRTQRQYWLQRFADPPQRLELGTDFPYPEADVSDAGHESARISAISMSSLKETCARNQCGLFIALLAALNVVLWCRSGQSDITVAVPLAGQSAANMPTLVGACSNQLAIRTVLRSEVSLRGLLRDIRETMIEAHENQHYTLYELRREPDLGHGHAPAAFPKVSLIHTKRLKPSAFAFRGLKTDYSFNHRRRQSSELLFHAIEYDDRLVLECSFRMDLHKPATIKRLLNDLSYVLAVIGTEPDTRIGALHHEQVELNSQLDSV